MRQALAFLTPIGGAAKPGPRALPFFAVVGALIGGAVGMIWFGAVQWWPPPVAAALAISADLALTGMLHFDGLADSADALLAPASRERRLEIMEDPRTGAFGVVVVATVLIVRFAAIASINPTILTPLVFAAIWATSRAAMAVSVCVLPYARRNGLASAFGKGNAFVIAGVAAPIAFVAGIVGAEPHLRGPLAVAGCAIGFALVICAARPKLGGFTGDVLGAAGVIGETVALLILAIRV